MHYKKVSFIFSCNFVCTSVTEWLDNIYIPTNQRRLQECYKIVSESLRGMRIPYVESESGFFVWVDFRRVGFVDTKL